MSMLETPAAPDARQQQPRMRVVIHRLDGGLEEGESDARRIMPEGFPIFTNADRSRPRIIPSRDIKYVVFGSVDDPDLGLREGSRRRRCHPNPHAPAG